MYSQGEALCSLPAPPGSLLQAGLASLVSGGWEDSQPGHRVYPGGSGVLGSSPLSHGAAGHVCPSARAGGMAGAAGGGEAQTSRPGSAAAPSGFQRGSALSAPLWAASGQRQLSNLRAGGGDSDQWEYQRCEAGMTSPRVCLLSEPRQATLPARSQAPAGRLRQQASAGHSRGVPTRRAGSQPGLRPGTSLGASSRLSGCQRWGL